MEAWNFDRVSDGVRIPTVHQFILVVFPFSIMAIMIRFERKDDGSIPSEGTNL